MRKYRKLKLGELERKVLRKVKDRKVKNIEVPTGIIHPRSRKKLTASAVNLTGAETRAFSKLWKKGLIHPIKEPPYFTNFRLTGKGKAQFR